MTGIRGFIAPGFEGVAESVAACGPGVAVAAFVAGELVVDVTTEPLSPASLVHAWSAIKPMTGACVLLVVERGLLELDQTVASVWPELDDPDLLVRHVLTHTAGRITCPDADLTDWDATVAALAAQPADARPGELICEHAVTVGLTDRWWADAGGDPTSLRARSLGPQPHVNGDAWRTAEIPAVNGHATALGLATWYQRLLEGRLPPLVDAAGVTGHDVFVEGEVTWTLAGGRIDGPDIGMGGLGGQWAAARPDRQLAWAFLTTRVGDFDRAQRVEDALLAALA